MSDNLKTNKYAAAILATALVGIGAHELSQQVFEPELPEEPGYAIEIPVSDTGSGDSHGGQDATAQAPPADMSIDLVALSQADPALGVKVAKRCAACHSFDAGGAIKQGPPLWGIVGRDVASYGDFQYSAALSGWGDKWDYQALYDYLRRPSEVVPGTAMNFIGLRKPKDRVNLIAYLRTLSENPQPIDGQ